jgi:hypothetical protein
MGKGSQTGDFGMGKFTLFHLGTRKLNLALNITDH